MIYPKERHIWKILSSFRYYDLAAVDFKEYVYTWQKLQMPLGRERGVLNNVFYRREVPASKSSP